jgi:hypothetical protein
MLRITVKLLTTFFLLYKASLGFGQSQIRELNLTLENLYHANENTSLIRLYFLDDSKTIGYRYGNRFPKDLVLLSRSRLMKVST